MKNLNVILSLILVLVMGTIASAQTVDDVICKATEAMGGQSAIDGVKSLKVSMTGTFMGGESGMEFFIEKPNKKMIKMIVNGMEVISATNGTDYWMSRMGQVMDMPPSAKEQFGSSFYQYSGANLAGLIGNGTFTYSGKEDVDGKSADVVQGAFTGSGDVSMYFDEAGLPFKMVMPTEEGDLDMYITDYRDVSGMKIAYKFESNANGAPMMAMEITEVEANVDFDPSVFARPSP